MTGQPLFAAPIAAVLPQGMASLSAGGARYFGISCRFAGASSQAARYAPARHISAILVH